MEFEIESEEPVSMAVVRAISAAEGRDPQSAPPLTTVVDPDALDLLFAPRHDGAPRPGGSVSFVYSDHRVTVENREYLYLESLTDRDLVQ